MMYRNGTGMCTEKLDNEITFLLNIMDACIRKFLLIVRYQLTLAVEASCSDGDPYCSALVLGRVLHQLVDVLAGREAPQFKEGEENREEYLMELAERMLKVPLLETKCAVVFLREVCC